MVLLFIDIVRCATDSADCGASDCWMTSVRKIGWSVEGAGRVAVQGHVAAFAGRDRR